MKNFHLDYYVDYPFARKAIIFLNAAKTLYEPQNRSWDSWEVAYYLISHSIELSIKAVAVKETGNAPFGHDKQELSEQYQKECNFSAEDLENIKQLKLLNNGKGGLRYDNEIQAEFLPSTFLSAVEIVERLISENFQKEETQ
jgi:HEPN domain-containing protein